MWISKKWFMEVYEKQREEIKSLKKVVYCDHQNSHWKRLYDDRGALTDCYIKECVTCGFKADYFGETAIKEMKKYHEGRLEEIEIIIGKDND
jgi:hypothetical protein